jgi:predicted transcriptional regulator
MEILWDASRPLTARDLAAALVGRSLAKTTVLTVLARLERKGRVARSREEWAHTYIATASREEYVAQLMHDALGSAADRHAVLARFVGQASEEEAEALRRLLAEIGDAE